MLERKIETAFGWPRVGGRPAERCIGRRPQNVGGRSATGQDNRKFLALRHDAFRLRAASDAA